MKIQSIGNSLTIAGTALLTCFVFQSATALAQDTTTPAPAGGGLVYRLGDFLFGDTSPAARSRAERGKFRLKGADRAHYGLNTYAGEGTYARHDEISSRVLSLQIVLDDKPVVRPGHSLAE